MKLLGAVLAGGRSSRFGSDKALAMTGGRPLIEHAAALLAAQCDLVVIVGRGDMADWPAPDRGPLGGLAGALVHAERNGFDAVLTCAVDSLGLPDDLRACLAPAPSYVTSQPVVGLWPTISLEVAKEVLRSGASASMRSFAEQIGARAVRLAREPANVNTPDDLARWEQSHGI